MTLDPPQKVNGELVGGIYFERLGQEGVKGTRCYSMTLSHQSQRGIVGPTAGGKVYDRGMTDNERIRQNTVQVRSSFCLRFQVGCLHWTCRSLRRWQQKPSQKLLHVLLLSRNWSSEQICIFLAKLLLHHFAVARLVYVALSDAARAFLV